MIGNIVNIEFYLDKIANEKRNPAKKVFNNFLFLLSMELIRRNNPELIKKKAMQFDHGKIAREWNKNVINKIM